MSDWKDEISRRLREREEKKNDFEVLMNHVEKTLDELIDELIAEYSIKGNVKTVGHGKERKWIIRIEDVTYEATFEKVALYYREHNSLKSAMISLILDHFTFEFKI